MGKKILAQGITKSIFDQDPVAGKFETLADLINEILPIIYVAAGLSMLVVLIMGGISLMLAGGDPAKIDKGYGMIKVALIGFFIVFLSYIITQVMETILGVKIL